MKRTASITLACAVALAAALAAGPASAFSKPVLDLAAGKTFGVDGTPNAGGLSVAVSPLWRAGDRALFGGSVFFDDIGTASAELFDGANGIDLGTIGDRHRMIYGLAWRGDYDLVQRRRWTAGLTGMAGWWRIQDDLRGDPVAAASAVGYSLGVGARRAMTPRHEVGIALRYQELTSDRRAGFRRVDHYATAGLEWRWTADGRQ